MPFNGTPHLSWHLPRFVFLVHNPNHCGNNGHISYRSPNAEWGCGVVDKHFWTFGRTLPGIKHSTLSIEDKNCIVYRVRPLGRRSAVILVYSAVRLLRRLWYVGIRVQTSAFFPGYAIYMYKTISRDIQLRDYHCGGANMQMAEEIYCVTLSYFRLLVSWCSKCEYFVSH